MGPVIRDPHALAYPHRHRLCAGEDAAARDARSRESRGLHLLLLARDLLRLGRAETVLDLGLALALRNPDAAHHPAEPVGARPRILRAGDDAAVRARAALIRLR